MVYSSIQKKVRKRKFLRLLNRYRLYIATAFALIVILAIVLVVKAVNSTEVQAQEQITAVALESEPPEETQSVTSALPLKAETPVAADLSIKEITFKPNEEDVEMLARLIWGEARGVDSTAQKAAVVWCVLNRVDASSFPDTIAGVVTQKHQFTGYSESFPVTEEFKEIAEDVLIRWYQEKVGAADVGRTLPSEYLFFVGDGVRNYFSIEWRSTDYFDWSLPSPYEK